MYIVLKYETRNSKLTRDRQKLEIKINISWGSILPNTTIKKKKNNKKTENTEERLISIRSRQERSSRLFKIQP